MSEYKQLNLLHQLECEEKLLDLLTGDTSQVKIDWAKDGMLDSFRYAVIYGQSLFRPQALGTIIQGTQTGRFYGKSLLNGLIGKYDGVSIITTGYQFQFRFRRKKPLKERRRPRRQPHWLHLGLKRKKGGIRHVY